MKIISPFLLPFLVAFSSCSSNINITGTYRSNFPDIGMFSTLIRIRQDSSFEYRFRGDMIFDTAGGHYEIIGKTLTLKYETVGVDSSLRDFSGKIFHPDTRTRTYGHKFYIGRKKLFWSYQDQRIVRRAKGYSKHKQYFLFGSHSFIRKHYLQKIKTDIE